MILAAAALALSPAAPAATGIRVADHPAYVRVVVDFDGPLPSPTEQLEARDPDPFADGRIALRLPPRVETSAAPVQAQGVAAEVLRVPGGVEVRARAERRRFKYASYTTLERRLVIDLFKSGPPSRAAEIRRGKRGCLRLSSIRRSGRTFTVSGRERNLFEHSYVLIARSASGRVLAERPGTGDPWRLRLRVPSRPATRTIEAAAFSARDGALVCLVQRRVSAR
jgi:hypothetical protein